MSSFSIKDKLTAFVRFFLNYKIFTIIVLLLGFISTAHTMLFKFNNIYIFALKFLIMKSIEIYYIYISKKFWEFISGNSNGWKIFINICFYLYLFGLVPNIGFFLWSISPNFHSINIKNKILTAQKIYIIFTNNNFITFFSFINQMIFFYLIEFLKIDSVKKFIFYLISSTIIVILINKLITPHQLKLVADHFSTSINDVIN